MEPTTDAKGKSSFNWLPVCLISGAFLIFSSLPSVYPTAGVFAAPLLIALILSACVLVFSPGFALLALVGKKIPASLSPGIVILGSSFGGWILFWAWFAHPLIGISASLAVSVLAMMILTFKSTSLIWKSTFLPTLVSIIVCIGYLALAGDRGGLQFGDNLTCGRYWAVMDNAIPRLFADGLIHDKAGLRPFLIADWHSSDRPPLQTGMIMVGYPFVKAGATPLAYQILSTAVNIFWIWGLWGFLRAFGLTERKILQAMILLILVGAMFINSVYTWPKMLAAALAFTVGTALWSQECPRRLKIFLVGGATALSLLAHGAAIFALMGLATLFWVRRKDWRWSDIIRAAVIAALIYLPWTFYQKHFDPPGDRLIKWHLAGVEPLDEGRPPLRTIVEEYQKAGLSGFAVNKIHNLRMLLGDPTDWDGAAARGYAHPGWNDSAIGQWRQFFVLRLGPAPMLLLLGIPLLFTQKVWQTVWFKPLLGTLLATLFIFVFFEFGSTPSSSTWLCHAPYTALILWCVVGALAIGEMDVKFFYIFLSIHLLIFVIMWDWNVPMWSAGQPPAYPGSPDLVARLIAGLSLLTLVVMFFRLNRQSSKTGD